MERFEKFKCASDIGVFVPEVVADLDRLAVHYHDVWRNVSRGTYRSLLCDVYNTHRIAMSLAWKVGCVWDRVSVIWEEGPWCCCRSGVVPS